jgi:hypothetical protein
MSCHRIPIIKTYKESLVNKTLYDILIEDVFRNQYSYNVAPKLVISYKAPIRDTIQIR